MQKPISKAVLRKPAVKTVACKKIVGTPLDKLRVGATVDYFCRTNPRAEGSPYRGKITEIDAKATGAWVKLHDKSRDVIITVRPSQIGASK